MFKIESLWESGEDKYKWNVNRNEDLYEWVDHEDTTPPTLEQNLDFLKTLK